MKTILTLAAASTLALTLGMATGCEAMGGEEGEAMLYSSDATTECKCDGFDYDAIK
ncbi:hypothetical protein [Mucisphaera calidilacus]|uniref:Uncharacterized protein n=1 Tax=Mucisphaera calidilacus TaxID=2527982 RepID=A0A518BTJ2_9BACT|nr:hypothetical protein [Mucisphaera calidilacus]QDU70286.1 hypothetical protein Pan265_01090 [Mucisphaera calidilacus]